MCELCGKKNDKEKRGKIIFLFFTRELLISFIKNIYITTIESCHFVFDRVRTMGLMECGKARNYVFAVMHKK